MYWSVTLHYKLLQYFHICISFKYHKVFIQFAVDSQRRYDVWIVSGTLVKQADATPTSKSEARRPLKSVESLLSALPCLWASLSAQISISAAIRAFSQLRFPSCSSASFLSSCTQQQIAITAHVVKRVTWLSVFTVSSSLQWQEDSSTSQRMQGWDCQLIAGTNSPR